MRFRQLLVPLAAGVLLAARPADRAAPGTVTGFNIVAAPKTFTGACPAKITWTATVHVANPPVQIQYRWERSDGTSSTPRRTTINDKTGEVTETWTLGGNPGAHLNVWQKVHVLSPNDKSSGSAPVKITCS